MQSPQQCYQAVFQGVGNDFYDSNLLKTFATGNRNVRLNGRSFLRASEALGYSDKQRLIFLNAFNIERIHMLTVAMWYGTFQKPGTSATGKFISHLFSLLFYGGVLYKSKGGAWTPWHKMGAPVTAVISHGARIIVQLPKAQLTKKSPDHRFFNWLSGGMKPISGLKHSFATHTVNQADPPEALYQRRKKYITEKKVGGKNAQKFLTDFGRHYRYNLPVGGVGNPNPWTGKTISANGEHGHLYIYYKAPTHSAYGALMLGIESEGPHSLGQTGHYHGTGGSEEFTAFGVRKWVQTVKDNMKKAKKDLGKLGDIGSKYDAMFIDLVGNGDDTDMMRVMRKAFNKDHLNKVPYPPPPLPRQFFSIMPTLAIWKKMSRGSGSRSRAGLTDIDKDVETYQRIKNVGPQRRRTVLIAIAVKCAQWRHKNRTKHRGRHVAVQTLRDLAVQEMKNMN